MATIIRKDSGYEFPAGRTVQSVAFSFSDMRDQADDYLESVRQEAAKIVQQAHREAEQIRRQAETSGRKAAEAAVDRIMDEKVAKRMDSLVPALEQLASQINDAKGKLLNHWEHSALKVSTAVAERIIRRQLDRQPEIALDLIADALRLAAGATEITLYVNPDDHARLGSQIERLGSTLCRLMPSQIVADPTVTAGGCRVQTAFGEIDQQIEAQLRRIEEDLA